MRGIANRPDRLTLWVLALFAVVAPLRAAEPIRVLALIAAMAAVVLAVAAWGARSHVGAIVHDVGSPALCVLGAFELGGSVMYVPASARWDHALSTVDVRLFGGLPDAWRAALGRPAWLTDAASLAYLSFFAFPVAIGAALYLTGRRREFERFAFIVLASFFVPYLGYLLMPATGPRVPIDREAVLLGGTAISTACRAFFRAGELNVIDAFPSAHTLVSLTTLSFAWRSFPRWRAASCALVAAILFATVFLSFHYVIDLVAGACLALAMPVIVGPLRSFCGPSSARKSAQRAELMGGSVG